MWIKVVGVVTLRCRNLKMGIGAVGMHIDQLA